MTHLSVLNTCETSSNNTEFCSKSNTTEDVTKPSCSYANETRQKIQPTGNNNGKGRSKKGRRKPTQKKKIMVKESNSMTRYLSKCGLSGIEPLEASNENYSGEKSLKDKVCSWLDTLPGNENLVDLDVVTKVEHVDSDLDDTLTMSVSENDAQSNRITDTNVDAELVLEPSVCNKSDTNRSTCKEIPETFSNKNESNENDKKSRINVGNYSSKMDFDTKPDDTKSKTVKSSEDDKGKSEEKFIEVQRTSPCDMLSAMQRNWSSVAKFGKEMRAKRKRLKSLDVSIENRGKRRSMDEVDEEKVGSFGRIGGASDRRGGSKCEKSNEDGNVDGAILVDEEFLECQKSLGTRCDEREDRERSISAEVQPCGESSFITLEEDGKIRIRNLNSCQMKAIIGVSDENRRIEGDNKEEEGEEETERQMEVFNTPIHDRSKIFSQMTPEGSHKDDQDRANLVDESVNERSLPTKGRMDEEHRSTPSKYQISTPSRKRLSLRRQSEDSKSNNTSNSDVGSRLNAVRRDLNRQIDKEEGNVDVGKENVDGIIGTGKRKTTGDERERNLTSNDYAGRKVEDKKRNASLVTFKKLGKFYKRGNEGRIKKRIPFFYLSATGKETSYYPGLHTHKSCNFVAMCNVKLEEGIDKSGTSIVSITDSSSNVKNVEAAKEPIKSKVKLEHQIVSENQENVAAGRISCEEIMPRPIDNANKSYDVDVLLISSDDEPSITPPIPKTDSSCKDTVKMSSPSSKDRSLPRFLSSSPPIDTLQTQKLNDLEPEPTRSKGKKPHSFACISPQCNSCCAPIEKCSSGNQRALFHEGTKENSENEGENDDSNHSLSSQTTCIRTTTPEVKNSRKSNLNERKRSPNPSSRETEVIQTGQNSDQDAAKTCKKEIREKVYNRIVLLDSSESESMDFVLLDGNDRSDASSKTEKRKRTASFDSVDETDLNAIVSNWCNDGILDERCKKKGKLERIRDTRDSSTSRENFSTKSLGNYLERELPP